MLFTNKPPTLAQPQMRTDPRVRVQAPPTSHPPTQHHHNGFRGAEHLLKTFGRSNRTIGSVVVRMACHRIGLDSNNITIKCPLIYMYSIHSHSHGFTLLSAASSSSSTSAVCRAPCRVWKTGSNDGAGAFYSLTHHHSSRTHTAKTRHICVEIPCSHRIRFQFFHVFFVCAYFPRNSRSHWQYDELTQLKHRDAEVREEGWRPITIIRWFREKVQVWHSGMNSMV